MIFSDTGAVHHVYVHPDALFGCSWCPTQKNVIATGCKVSVSGRHALKERIEAEMSRFVSCHSLSCFEPVCANRGYRISNRVL